MPVEDASRTMAIIGAVLNGSAVMVRVIYLFGFVALVSGPSTSTG